MIDNDRVNERIRQLELEIEEKREEIEITNNQSTIAKLEEEVYNTQHSIKELKKYV